jgi:transmembrane sensor
MNNVHQLGPSSQTMDKACEWLVKVDRGLSPDEELVLKSWLAADEEHVDVFIRVATLWDKLDALTRLADLFPQQALERSRFKPAAWAIAASLLLAATVGLWVSSGTDPRSTSREIAASAMETQVFETAIGNQSTVDLPDGSQLMLNTNSHVTATFSNNERTLVLQRGEVHVRVAHDTKRPFRVYVGEKFVEAVGTEFNLEITSDQRIELIVSEGKVLVGVQDPDTTLASSYSSDGNERANAAKERESGLISAGKRVVLGDEAEEIETIAAEDIAVKLSWRDGNLVFNGESLAEAIDEVERYTAVEFVIMDEDLKKVRVAGRFKAGDVEGLLKTLKQNFNVAYERVGEEKIILTGN